jgi:hypothetical protein
VAVQCIVPGVVLVMVAFLLEELLVVAVQVEDGL